MIKIEDCKDGFLYKVDCRNGMYGRYNEKTKGFKIAREKFGDVYLFEELHWDTGAPFGTAKPEEEIEDVGNLNDDDLLQLLFALEEYDKKLKKLQYKDWVRQKSLK